MIEHRQHGGHEEEQHLGHQPLRAATHADDADPPARQQGKHDQHADNVAGQRQAGEMHDDRCREPEAENQGDLDRSAVVDGTAARGEEPGHNHGSGNLCRTAACPE